MRSKVNQYKKRLAYITSVDHYVDEIYWVVLKLLEPIMIKAGQYIMLENLKQKWCAYSVFEQFDACTLVLLVKAVSYERNIVYFKKLISKNISIYVRGPCGICIPDSEISHTVCIVHGVAIAPVNLILLTLNKYNLNNKRLSIIWYINQERLMPLVNLINKRVVEAPHTECFLLSSILNWDPYILKTKISQIMFDKNQTECLLFGSLRFVQYCMDLLDKTGFQAIKSDY